MIVITGGLGFVGSNLISYFVNEDIICVDDFSLNSNLSNVEKAKIVLFLDKNSIFNFINENNSEIDMVFHLGAIASTKCIDDNKLFDNNTVFSVSLYEICKKFNIRFLFSSSSAIYANGEFITNSYALSKKVAEDYMINYGNNIVLRFFNIYGPHEHHKKQMASLPFVFYQHIINNNKIKMFFEIQKYLVFSM